VPPVGPEFLESDSRLFPQDDAQITREHVGARAYYLEENAAPSTVPPNDDRARQNRIGAFLFPPVQSRLAPDSPEDAALVESAMQKLTAAELDALERFLTQQTPEDQATCQSSS